MARRVGLSDSVRRSREKSIQDMWISNISIKMGSGIPNQNNFRSQSFLSQSFRHDLQLKLYVPSD